MSQVVLAKGILTVTGIMLFLWAREDDQAMLRWIAIGMILCAWLLRFVERRLKGEVHGESEVEGKR